VFARTPAHNVRQCSLFAKNVRLFLFQIIFGTKFMQPFMEDQALAQHLAELQPRPQRRPRPAEAPASFGRLTGTLVYLRGNAGFVAPDGTDPRDRSSQLFVHMMALQRAGLDDISIGAKISYAVRRAKFAGGKPECQEIELVAP
jgi:cold shock CspA family protein